jgi:hypothetical protein
VALVKGQPSPIEGFIVNEARPGRTELIHSSGAPQFAASTEAKVLSQAADWVAVQAQRGSLAPAPVVEEPEAEEDVIEA